MEGQEGNALDSDVTDQPTCADCIASPARQQGSQTLLCIPDDSLQAKEGMFRRALKETSQTAMQASQALLYAYLLVFFRQREGMLKREKQERSQTATQLTKVLMTLVCVPPCLVLAGRERGVEGREEADEPDSDAMDGGADDICVCTSLE